MSGFQLMQDNSLSVMLWQRLDLTGRNRGMQEEPLREEAIDAILSRYDLNEPKFYEKIVAIEAVLFSHRQEEQSAKREAERKTQEQNRKAQAAQQRARSASRPRRR